LGLLARLRDLLAPGLLSVIDDVTTNPDTARMATQYRRFWHECATAEVIVAVGGGSVLDTAKVLAVRTPSGEFGELLDCLARGARPPVAAVRAVIAIPTTAGTGSEVTPWATLWDRVAQAKYSLHLPALWPEAALVDPQLTESLPAETMRSCALDALSHALESIWNVNANPVSDTLAVEAAQGVITTLPAWQRDPANRALRARLARASLTAGLAFSNTQTALAHSLSYPLTLRYGLAHGIACSFTLPLVWRLAAGRDPGRDTVLARVFGAHVGDAPAALERFLNDVGVATDSAAYGVDAAQLAALLAGALDGARGRNFIGAQRVAA
jgi:hypothetical protein